MFMEMTMGNRIVQLRRKKGIKQEELAQTLGVSPQAVSKWENDQTCPDVMTLPKLAKLLGTTVDYLLSGESAPDARIVPVEQRKDIKDLMLRIMVDTSDGDRVRVNLPMALVEVAVNSGVEISQFTGSGAVNHIDLKQVLDLVRQGCIGNLVEVDSADGDTVRIFVE